jgi:hypothetical protein
MQISEHPFFAPDVFAYLPPLHDTPPVFIFPRRAEFDKKNPNGLLFSCAKSVEKFAATLVGPAVSIIFKFCLQFSTCFLFSRLRAGHRQGSCPSVAWRV